MMHGLANLKSLHLIGDLFQNMMMHGLTNLKLLHLFGDLFKL
jgi:hypothetical protein